MIEDSRGIKKWHFRGKEQQRVPIYLERCGRFFRYPTLVDRDGCFARSEVLFLGVRLVLLHHHHFVEITADLLLVHPSQIPEPSGKLRCLWDTLSCLLAAGFSIIIRSARTYCPFCALILFRIPYNGALAITNRNQIDAPSICLLYSEL